MIDTLYYGDQQCHCGCGHHHFHNVDGAVRFNADVLAKFLKTIYRGFDTDHGVEATMWREVLRIINEGTVEGLAKAKTPPAHDVEFYKALRHSNEVFAAFKVHVMGQEMAAKLYDADGRLKPFAQWADDVRSISSHQVGSWLQTEYDTAVIRAHTAADWREFERNKDILPNLRWMPTTSKDPESSHREYWVKKLTLPVDDPFWEEHHPGDRWNCKCSLEATDDPVARLDDMEPTKPQRGLENNPGKDGHTFSQEHPYFPKSCSSCSFYKPGFMDKLSHLFNNKAKNCYNCPYMNGCLAKIQNSKIKPPKVEEYKVEHNGHVFISPYHGGNEVDDNKRLAAFVADKLKTEVYLLPRLDPNNPVENRLRLTLLPPGVFDNKNPDFLINGKLFDGKCMYDLDRNANLKQQKSAIENHIKKAKKQAENIILELPTFMDRRNAENTIRNYLNRSKIKRVIMARYGNKLLIFQN